MARKHNTKHLRSRSNYPKRLADRGLGKAPRMRWTGLSTAQIQEAFAGLPRYRWNEESFVDENGRRHTRSFRTQVN